MREFRTAAQALQGDLRRPTLDFLHLFAQRQRPQRRGLLRLYEARRHQALPVSEWAADDCVLLLWTTDPLLEQAFEVIRAWGFTYKTVGFYWAKLRKPEPSYSEGNFFTGLGFWTRANPETCLLATRGKPHRLSANVRKLIVSPRREHSRKPDEVYARIEALCEGPYLEMFARSSQPGWDRWGLDANLREIGPRRWRATSYPSAPQAAD